MIHGMLNMLINLIDHDLLGVQEHLHVLEQLEELVDGSFNLVQLLISVGDLLEYSSLFRGSRRHDFLLEDTLGLFHGLSDFTGRSIGACYAILSFELLFTVSTSFLLDNLEIFGNIHELLGKSLLLRVFDSRVLA